MCLVESRWQCRFEWLLHYGHHVTSLEVNLSTHPVSQIPCPNLLELECFHCSVQLGPAADGSPGVIQGCTKLTRLQLVCNIADTPPGAKLDSLSSLVHLEDLFIESWYPVALPRGTLPCLTRLTQLSVSNLAEENLAELGSLTNLQQLGLLGGDRSPTVGPSSVPGLVFPASLAELSLSARVEAGLLSLVPTALRSLHVECVVDGPAEGPGSFLACIARLQHLTDLHIEPHGGPTWPPAGPAYSALTASSNLESLCICNTTLPVGVWSHVFPATHKLPHLTSFELREEMDGADPSPSWGVADLSALVTCCPNLCEIHDQLYMQPGLHVSELHKLTGLVSLEVNYGRCDPPELYESLQGLAAVTQLRDLTLDLRDTTCAIPCLWPLTSLTALTQLCCQGVQDSVDGDVIVEQVTVSCMQQADCYTPVWVQLLRLCAEDNQGARDRLAQLLADPAAVALHRAVTLDQDGQLSAQRSQMVRQSIAFDRQLATLQASAEQQAALVHGLRQQLAAQHHVMTEQAMQIAGLQGEVAAGRQAAAQQQELLVQQQQQLAVQQQQQQLVQQQVMTQQGTQIAQLQGQLQAMQSLVQGLLQRQLH